MEDCHIILIIGEGNFSFTLSLANQLNNYYNKNYNNNLVNPITHLLPDVTKIVNSPFIISTSYDSFQEVCEKYPESFKIFEKLKNYKKVKCLHKINAWELNKYFPAYIFSSVIWNHPHLGIEQFEYHSHLFFHFFPSASWVLKKDGCVTLTLIEGQSEKWDLLNKANQNEFLLYSKKLFCMKNWPGYESKRNTCSKSFKNLATQRHMNNKMSSDIYIFIKKLSNLFTDIKDNVTDASIESNEHLCIFSEISNTQDDNKANHLANETNLLENNDNFICIKCSKNFTSSQGLRTHYLQVHVYKKYGEFWTPSRSKNLKCFICEKFFRDEEARWQHFIYIHFSCYESKILQQSLQSLKLSPENKDEKSIEKTSKNSSKSHNTTIFRESYKSLLEFISDFEKIEDNTNYMQTKLQSYSDNPSQITHSEIKCPFCESSPLISGKNILNNLKPNNEEILKCSICCKFFFEKRALMQHLNYCFSKLANVKENIYKNHIPVSQFVN